MRFFAPRAMEVLDLLLTFQFNSRLESFIAKFKTADLSSTGHQRGVRSLLCPLLVESFDPFDQSKYDSTTLVHAGLILMNLFKLCNIFPLLYPSSPLPSLRSYPLPPLRSQPLNSSCSVWGALPVRFGAEPKPKSNLVRVVTVILMIFLGINRTSSIGQHILPHGLHKIG